MSNFFVKLFYLIKKKWQDNKDNKDNKRILYIPQAKRDGIITRLISKYKQNVEQDDDQYTINWSLSF